MPEDGTGRELLFSTALFFPLPQEGENKGERGRDRECIVITPVATIEQGQESLCCVRLALTIAMPSGQCAHETLRCF